MDCLAHIFQNVDQVATAGVGITWAKTISSLLLVICGAMVLFILVRMVLLVVSGQAFKKARKRAEPSVTTAASQDPPAKFARGTSLRSLRMTMSAPAFLVPMAIAIVITIIATEAVGRHHLISENPFGVALLIRQPGGMGHNHSPAWRGDDPANLILLGLIAVCLAGHVGLLRAAYARRSPTSADFLQGIKDHTITLVLGKFLLFLGIAGVSQLVGWKPTWTAILFVVPSLLLAPLVGTTALYPRQPLRAIKAALVHCTNDVHGTGKLVTIQILLLLGAWAWFAVGHGITGRGIPMWTPAWVTTNGTFPSIPLLANGISTLSFNTFPMVHLFWNDIRELLAIGFTVICSTVFLGCHFLKVMDTVREETADGAGAAAGQAA